MRLLLVALVLALTPCVATAGTSDQDPAVDFIRRLFAQARVPDSASLHFGKTWDCTFRPAERGAFRARSFPSHHLFDAFGELIRSSGVKKKWLYFTTPQGLLNVGSNPIGGWDYIRISPEGQILEEIVTIVTPGDMYEPAVADPQWSAYGYLVCAPIANSKSQER